MKPAARHLLCGLCLLWASASPLGAANVNLLVNPTFEWTYAARRLPAMTNFPADHARKAHRALPRYAGEAFPPHG